jgi:hypothetical protein
MKTIEDILASAGAGAYGEDSDLIGKVFGVVMATVLVNKGAGPFICGTLRKPGTDGLHEEILRRRAGAALADSDEERPEDAALN